jgi:hypothetical protein
VPLGPAGRLIELFAKNWPIGVVKGFAERDAPAGVRSLGQVSAAAQTALVACNKIIAVIIKRLIFVFLRLVGESGRASGRASEGAFGSLGAAASQAADVWHAFIRAANKWRAASGVSGGQAR